MCVARAAANEQTDVPRFSDPTAVTLLSDRARSELAAGRAATAPLGARIRANLRSRRTKMIALRTVEIDDAVRAVSAPQVVLLGAGLDGRAFRMPELHDALVFEVDHPDTQQVKRRRAAALTPSARELRFVPVDFGRDDLARALREAGHDATVPTIWVWEGVIMYLTRQEVEATLACIGRRSAVGSRLIALYHRDAPVLRIVGLLVRLVGEPFRSTFSPEAMRSLLQEHGFVVLRDRDIPEIARELTPRTAAEMRVMKHTRICVAERTTVG